MVRKGKTPKWGIEQQETGIFASSIEYTPSNETYEQLDVDGEVCGAILRKQKVELSMSGEVPETGGGAWNMGASVALVNQPPDDIWLEGAAPEATTTIVTGRPYTLERESAQQMTISAVIYPFSSEVA